MGSASPQESSHETWDRYKRALGDESLPAGLVDLDAFDTNTDRLVAIAKSAQKTLRVASKSVRVPRLLKRLVDRGEGVVRGLMTYHARETAFLAEQGFDDFLLAYPTVHKGDVAVLAKLAQSGKVVSTVVDDVAQLGVFEQAGAAAHTRMRLVIELDVAWRPMAQVHLGPRRSPVRTPEDVVALAKAIAAQPHLEFAGVMAYEGHIAGVTDENPFTRAINPAKRLIKLMSRGEMETRRARVVEALTRAGLPPPLFNGGGSGSLTWSGADSALTELTAGSGFMDSHLFDYYRDLKVEPATFFALQVVRRPTPTLLTCHGGGFIASGEAGVDRLPVPSLPAGLKLLSLEGAGEVQTPVVVPEGVSLTLGDPVFFRHAKAGELAEHFNEYLLVRGDKVEARAPTYRGLGQCFLG